MVGFVDRAFVHLVFHYLTVIIKSHYQEDLLEQELKLYTEDERFNPVKAWKVSGKNRAA